MCSRIFYSQCLTQNKPLLMSRIDKIRWWLVIEKSTLHHTKHQEASSSKLGRGGEISPNCLWHSCGGVPACHVLWYSVNHLYISIYFRLKINSPSQCLATKLKDKCMRSSAASVHTPRHAAVPNMNELCCRYQSQKRSSIKNVQQQKVSRSHNVVC